VAFFGTEGLYCYDKDGELQWKKDFGVLDAGWYMSKNAQWGFGSSPVIHEGRVYLQCDVQEGSFVTCLELDTGKEVWRTERDEVPGWGSPTVDVAEERRQLICNGYKHLGAYDLDTGAELWKLAERGGDIPVPTPVVAHGLAFLTNAHGRMAPILAISTKAEGAVPIDADGKNTAWSERSSGNYMQTPLVYGDELYMCKDMGILTCYDARTGEQHYRKRLETGLGFTASGVAAGGAVYFTSEPGDVYVVKAGKTYDLLGINQMGENCMATPAISGDTLFFRTQHHLVAIAEGQRTDK
jgi:outer membrane protein assembly factor BamB